MILQSTTVGLVAHMMTICLLWALIFAIFLASKQKRALNWQYWRLLCGVLGVWSLWFFGLAISTRNTELISRDVLAWLLRSLELVGALSGWCWLLLTMRRSFRIVRHPPKPYNSDNWAIGD